MKCQLVLPACLLLLWTLTASVSCKDVKITVKDVSNQFTLACGDNLNITFNEQYMDKPVPYDDVYTGEYTCISADNKEESKIYVKFRTCNNCIELDVPSIVGIVIGNVAATIVIGVAVYLTASQNRIGPNTAHKKNPDRPQSGPHEPSSRAPYQPYERLQHHQKDEYDKLNNRK
ncbi:T-cell surface glycoprotein CD3 epsilon chain [Sander lucioperca]|uniref:T-cell surface glycoprotein CD3 epsilon chain n=1 Tax=Sander lucioperca TaxID=283035 RepID=UPI001653C511|nr:T-cell surface glycoprotein CD3 epsilon chain [Sander lucioperca]XP_035857292.1 T-cell surface glycoprotein CD3 epsilon chain [Sander lucioperca]